jgi:hypothetical protein
MLNEKKENYPELISFLDHVTQLLQETSIIINEEFFNHTSSRYSMIQTTLLPEI